MEETKVYKPKVDISTLNEDQKKAFEQLRDYIIDKKNDDIYVLKGWAGTGKTYCVSILVRFILEVVHPNKKFYKVAVTGPTNKSVRVIKKTAGITNSRVSFQTIHKMLGLTERITSDGRQEFVNQGDFVPPINSIKLLIIDEVSMLNDELFEEIIKYRNQLKIICMGDPAQIPPVGKADCIPFSEDMLKMYRIKTVELKKIMRQKEGNPIIETSIKIRNDIENPSIQLDNKTVVNEKGEGIEFLNLENPKVRNSFSEVLSNYFRSENFKKDPEYCKIIAWRNKTVESMNNLVRKVIYGEDRTCFKILEGEKLVANNPIIENENIIFNTNDEFTVESFEIKDHKIKIEDIDTFLKYYETRVSYISDDDKNISVYIDILHEDSESNFNVIAAKLKKIAIDKKGKDRSWIRYYNFLRKYADVNYGYSQTCHKSQGSTYQISFVLEDDINMNPDVVERNRIKYTAYTRASKKVYVLKRF